MTDANGFYHFTGLPAGTYAVVEVQPEGVIDSVDTPGTLGGFAVNPRRPSVADPAGRRFRRRSQADASSSSARSSATTRSCAIPLQYGEHSQENNFSEVDDACPPPPLAAAGSAAAAAEAAGVRRRRRAPFVPKLVLPPVRRSHDRRTSSAVEPTCIGYTWHLSVVNAGWPRSMTPGEVRVPADVGARSTSPAGRTCRSIGGTLDAGHGRRQQRRRAARGSVRHATNAMPVTGDFNGDGVTTSACSSTASGSSISTATASGTRATCGPSSAAQDDLPVTGDWDADGKTDIGIYGPAWPRDPWAIAREPGLPDADNFPTRPAAR